MYKKGGWSKVGMETDLSNLSSAWRKHGMHPGLGDMLPIQGRH